MNILICFYVNLIFCSKPVAAEQNGSCKQKEEKEDAPEKETAETKEDFSKEDEMKNTSLTP